MTAKYKNELYDYIGVYKSFKVYGKKENPNEILLVTTDNKIVDQFISKRTREFIEGKHEI